MKKKKITKCQKTIEKNILIILKESDDIIHKFTEQASILVAKEEVKELEKK